VAEGRGNSQHEDVVTEERSRVLSATIQQFLGKPLEGLNPLNPKWKWLYSSTRLGPPLVSL